jgi:hypothetical protein
MAEQHPDQTCQQTGSGLKRRGLLAATTTDTNFVATGCVTNFDVEAGHCATACVDVRIGATGALSRGGTILTRVHRLPLQWLPLHGGARQ